MASEFGGLYRVKHDRRSIYLDVIWALAEPFESITITLKPRNDIRYADALAYLAAALDDNLPRKISVDNLEHTDI